MNKKTLKLIILGLAVAMLILIIFFLWVQCPEFVKGEILLFSIFFNLFIKLITFNTLTLVIFILFIAFIVLMKIYRIKYGK
jgi:hypothetical protein